MTPGKPIPYDHDLPVVNVPFVHVVPDVVLVGESVTSLAERAVFEQKVRDAGNLIAEARDRAYGHGDIMTMARSSGKTTATPLNLIVQVSGDSCCPVAPARDIDWKKPKAALRGDTRRKKPWEH